MSLFRSLLHLQRPAGDSMAPTAEMSLTTNHEAASDTARSERDLSSLERRSFDLHQQLQLFLDAQIQGLSAGHDHHPIAQGTASFPVTSQLLPQRKTVPVRQPAKDSITLRAARRGIKKAMHDLSSIKYAELQMIDVYLQETHWAVSKVDGWEHKRDSLNEEICSIQEGPMGARVRHLSEQSETLREEIANVELQLSELKSRQRSVQSELSTLSNSTQSKLSSYHAAQQLLEDQIRDYLANPIDQLAEFVIDRTYLSLPLERRTLGMARQYTSQAQDALQKRRQVVENEKLALEEGIETWSEAVRSLTILEKYFVACLASLNASPAPNSPGTGGHPYVTNHGLQGLHFKFDQALSHLQTMVKAAESSGYNLLLCCIGAETEALSESHQILLETFPSFAAEPCLYNHEDGDINNDTATNPPQYIERVY